MGLDDFRSRSAMGKYEIEEHLHAEIVGLVHKVLEILICAIFRIHTEIVSRTIRITGIVEAGLYLTRTPLAAVHVGVSDIQGRKI